MALNNKDMRSQQAFLTDKSQNTLLESTNSLSVHSSGFSIIVPSIIVPNYARATTAFPDIPLEIKMEVYRHALPANMRYKMKPSYCAGENFSRTRHDLALLQTSKDINIAASPIFYKQNTFLIDFDSQRALPYMKRLGYQVFLRKLHVIISLERPPMLYDAYLSSMFTSHLRQMQRLESLTLSVPTGKEHCNSIHRIISALQSLPTLRKCIIKSQSRKATVLEKELSESVFSAWYCTVVQELIVNSFGKVRIVCFAKDPNAKHYEDPDAENTMTRLRFFRGPHPFASSGIKGVPYCV